MKIVNSENVQPDGSIVEIVTVIDEEANTATSMLKATYETQQAEQSTPIVIDEAEAK
jgi:hypothetical protein